ncbi:phospholipase D delta-like [Andrographis paniculata]|uniref:phospholipase D delta-like n=1 Tax=Andrographis paniculata TaxID=175694 RepID=UPI0021E75CB2|nr:phospholipase D delta-like [Andrographis paniculata]
MAADNDVVFLHGDLELTIIEARSLPNMDMVSEHLRRVFTALNTCRKPLSVKRKYKRKDLRRHNNMITSDPYVSVCLAGARVATTRVISNSQNPVWNENLKIPVAHPVSEVDFEVKDDDLFGADHIGAATVPAKRIVTGEVINEWFPLIGLSGKPHKPDSAIRLQIKYTPCHMNPLYQNGVSENYELKESFFPLRHGGKVTLYQDAHLSEDMLPEVKLDENRRFTHEACWEEICHAILEAHHLVYIAGWSIYDKVRLVREPTKPLPKGGDLTLGELLKYKSQEGVRVLLLVWDDKTSHSKCFIKTEGVMQTHDEKTKKYFKRSSVQCVLAPRYASAKLSIFKQQVVGTLYTHHQKCVILDTQGSGSNRKITSFIGGLDLCDGRYDTPEHRLFRDLDTVFQDDYHNPTFAPGTRAPRQPWHDLHCKIEGPAAYDVLTNFEQRWKKATRWSELGERLKKISYWHEDALLKVERISWIASPTPTAPNDHPSLWVSQEDDPENWHVQIFRSIDSGSVKGFFNTADAVEKQGLMFSKNLVVDRSIQMAYVQAIRSAQHFIYIENQYFLGSSYAWPSYKHAGADNLIPMELALKIASKIRAKERFNVYIVIPLWPEGIPTSAAVQEILYWQGQTMQMMYELIAQEIKSADLENAHPTDYLNFYCLGNREETHTNEHSGSHESDSQRYGRFMIYVHAKGMIVDDEYVIVGSANINQRSMDGSRDTEIAMGAYQPHYTWANSDSHPHGQIYGYRMSLWAEHLGKIEKCLEDPTKPDCLNYLNSTAEDNWRRFTGSHFTPLQGHLLKYPVKVEIDGKVKPLPGFETFPDVGGKVLGAPTTLPDALTT